MNLQFQDQIPVEFNDLSKVWIYQSSRLFLMSEALEIEAILEQFVASWKSHGDEVKGFGNLFFGQFIVLMADETATGVSGCSTDSSVRIVKEIEQKYAVQFFERQTLAFVVKDKMQLLPLSQLSYAAENEFIKGVVGWIDLCADTIHERLEHYSQFPKLKGFRHILQAEPIEFILKPEFQRGITALQVYGFTYDILIYPQHLPVIPDLIRGGNEQKFILDHLAKPNIKNGTSATWAADLKKLAFHKNVFCKLSGMVTEADHKTWKKEDIYPYMDKVLEFFGPERLLFGSDWPVCRLAASYGQVCDLMNAYLERLTIHEQELIWGKNAALFYKL